MACSAARSPAPLPTGCRRVEDDGLDFAHRVAESSEVRRTRLPLARAETEDADGYTLARRYARPTGALELMEDLGGAGPGTLMLARQPGAHPRGRGRVRAALREIAADAAQFGASRPATRRRRRPAFGRRSPRRSGRHAGRSRAQRGAHCGSHRRFTLFNLLAAETGSGRRRILLRSPGVIGYATLPQGRLIVSRPAAIEDCRRPLQVHVAFRG